jgi:VIT1/CCC1 family predicted Fe2+/Mn2+ transporter
LISDPARELAGQIEGNHADERANVPARLRQGLREIVKESAHERIHDRISENVNPSKRGGTLALSNGSISVGGLSILGGTMAALAFVLVYFFGLTVDGLIGAFVSLLACFLLFNVMAKDHSNR